MHNLLIAAGLVIFSFAIAVWRLNSAYKTSGAVRREIHQEALERRGARLRRES